MDQIKKKLIIEEIFADEGPKLKRIRPRAQGRAYKILKPTCHITVVMKEYNLNDDISEQFVNLWGNSLVLIYQEKQVNYKFMILN